MTFDEAKERERFERWISGPPYELSVVRYPSSVHMTSWPGQYRDINVERAWEAWCQALNGEKE